MIFDEIMYAIFLVAVLALVLPAFLSSNNKLREIVKNLSVWAVIVLIIIVIIYLIK